MTDLLHFLALNGILLAGAANCVSAIQTSSDPFKSIRKPSTFSRSLGLETSKKRDKKGNS